MQITTIVEDALRQPKDAILFHFSKALATAFPDKHLLETDSWAFNIREFRQDGHCQLRTHPEMHSQWDWEWDHQHHSEYATERIVWFEVQWQEHKLDAVVISTIGQHRDEQRWYLLAESQEVNRSFFKAVADWTSEVRGEVLVFDGGCWQKSKDLFDSIQLANWDNLILGDNLKEEIRTDLGAFFDSKGVYERYGIPWKRGILFLGPPGNGKTHTVKAIVGSIGFPSLYVKSFKAEYRTDHQLIGEVFQRARSSAPCILVLEDLDALIDEENRSFFLNELDGFASNHGIVTIGTTNHPERLDPAILERPSRFDRKYTFGLPALPDREAYLKMFSARLEPDLRLDADGLAEVSAATDGYSFAYLKELYLSAMMRWVADPGGRPIGSIMVEQSEALRSQMATDPAEEVSSTGSRRPDFSNPEVMRAYMRRWKR